MPLLLPGDLCRAQRARDNVLVCVRWRSVVEAIEKRSSAAGQHPVIRNFSIAMIGPPRPSRAHPRLSHSRRLRAWLFAAVTMVGLWCCVVAIYVLGIKAFDDDAKAVETVVDLQQVKQPPRACRRAPAPPPAPPLAHIRDPVPARGAHCHHGGQGVHICESGAAARSATAKKKA